VSVAIVITLKQSKKGNIVARVDQRCRKSFTSIKTSLPFFYLTKVVLDETDHSEIGRNKSAMLTAELFVMASTEFGLMLSSPDQLKSEFSAEPQST